MSNIEEVLEISDEKLEMEFKESCTSLNDELKSRIKNLVAKTPHPISVGTYNSSFGACCCTIQNNSNACGGDGYLPNSTNCTPGGT
jgi:hypothetical protein